MSQVLCHPAPPRRRRRGPVERDWTKVLKKIVESEGGEE
jgi:hypothetical protein